MADDHVPYPTYGSVMADIMSGVPEDVAIRRASQQLADAIDDEIMRKVYAEFAMKEPSDG